MFQTTNQINNHLDQFPGTCPAFLNVSAWIYNISSGRSRKSCWTRRLGNSIRPNGSPFNCEYFLGIWVPQMLPSSLPHKHWIVKPMIPRQPPILWARFWGQSLPEALPPWFSSGSGQLGDNEWWLDNLLFCGSMSHIIKCHQHLHSLVFLGTIYLAKHTFFLGVEGGEHLSLSSLVLVC